MNKMSSTVKSQANDEAILNTYLYINQKGTRPVDGVTKLTDAVAALEASKTDAWSAEDTVKLEILKNAIDRDPRLGEAVIGNQYFQENGINACTFTFPDGKISAAFMGTAGGEWIDNGEGLSGVPESNTYYTYDNQGNIIGQKIVNQDYATDQQVQALNWFNQAAAKNGWTEEMDITVSGHSKGGNKAQFITIHSELVDRCYSLDGQGFSPEALESFQKQYGPEYDARRKKIYTVAAYNDYVNVLGERLTPKNQIYFFESPDGDASMAKYHYLETILQENGEFRAQRSQGEISEYLQQTSHALMLMEPELRQNVTLGAMQMVKTMMAPNAVSVNGDYVSDLQTRSGIATAIPIITYQLMTPNGAAAAVEALALITNNIANEHGIVAGVGAALAFAGLAPTLISVVAIKTADEYLRIVAIDAGIKIGKMIRDLSIETYQRVKNFLSTTISALAAVFPKASGWNSGGVAQSGAILVDTQKLNNYAQQLETINTKLNSIDKKMDSLYTQVGLRDLFKLIRADAMTSYSSRISNCAQYLRSTANDFETTERSVAELF